MMHLHNLAQSTLLQAVDHFKKRIIPAFEKVEAQMEEIQSLRRDLARARSEKEQLDAKYRKARKVEMNAEKMKQSMAQVSSERDTALRLAEQASQETITLRQTRDEYIIAMNSLQEDNERYRGQLQKHVDMVSIQGSFFILKL